MSRTPSTPRTRQPLARKITLIVLGVLVLGTVVLLPQFVTEPWIAGDTVDQVKVPTTPSADTVQPSTAAELKHFRQESQGVLAEIMVIRDRLENAGVEQWAEVEFQQALGNIQGGDEKYAFGDYEASLEQYRRAREQLSGIEKTGQQKLAEAKADGLAAIESLNVNIATAASELGMAMAPDDPEVQSLAARAETLPQVAGHIEAADQALALDRFEQARTEYRQALDLDPRHQRAAEGLALAGNEITGSAFRRQMSRGFAALEGGDFEGARAGFRKAGDIDPGNPAVAQALAQVDNRESLGIVNAGLANAAELESEERWGEAVAVYESLLEQDPSLADAAARLVPVKVRAELDERLGAYIDEPLLLSNKTEFQTARMAVDDARGIANPGPKLQQQIASLETLLKRAESPVDVVFRSDNHTYVVLRRVAELGRFDRTSVKLRPGRYVAAGSRSGYRDVRVEFTITGEPQDEPIVVRCVEPVG